MPRIKANLKKVGGESSNVTANKKKKAGAGMELREEQQPHSIENIPFGVVVKDRVLNKVATVSHQPAPDISRLKQSMLDFTGSSRDNQQGSNRTAGSKRAVEESEEEPTSPLKKQLTSTR